MRNFGIFLLIVGMVGLIIALSLDTTVPAGFGTRVNNIGLMAQKQNYIIVGAFVLLCGLLMLIFGGKKISVNYAKCPFCAESIMPEAIKCKHCGSDISGMHDKNSPNNIEQ